MSQASEGEAGEEGAPGAVGNWAAARADTLGLVLPPPLLVSPATWPTTGAIIGPGKQVRTKAPADAGEGRRSRAQTGTRATTLHANAMQTSVARLVRAKGKAKRS